MKSILCDAQLLTIMDKRAHAVSKMPNTLKLWFGQASFADRIQSENCRKYSPVSTIMKLFLWLLQIVAEMVRNLIMAYIYVKQVKDCAQKLGISSSCVWLITIIIQREQDALQNI